MKKFIKIFLFLIIFLNISIVVYADGYELDAVISDTAFYVYSTVNEPSVGSIGGEWAIFGLARSGYNVPAKYYDGYYSRLEETLRKNTGVLHERKYTEYSRVIIALTSIGKSPEDVAGYNLTAPLGDYEKTIWQGMNGPIWALIALDCGEYKIPENTGARVQATRNAYIQRILDMQLPDGGWSLHGGKDSYSDTDITAMALQALSKYKSDKAVSNAIEKGVAALSEMQDQNGGYQSSGIENSESCSQVLVALCELGIPLTDARFVKNGNTVFDALMCYYEKGKGFSHSRDKNGVSLMSTEQALYALAALKRAKEDKSSLYTVNDPITYSVKESGSVISERKHKDVIVPLKVSNAKEFTDISNNPCRKAIIELSSRGIINGRSEGIFHPDSNMTRAEFAAIVTRGLGLPSVSVSVFNDVTEGDWFYSPVGTAFSYGIINGISEKEFNPGGVITLEEAAVMTVRAASLCGMDTALSNTEIRNVLSQFSDYVRTSSWSREALAFCYKEGLLSDEVMEISPSKRVTRAEIADMLYNMLTLSALILE